MPGVTDTSGEKIVEALPAPAVPEHTAEVLPNQPRQPSNLHGLLRFAMEATKADDAPGASELGPMDEERKKFLEEALKTMTINVMELLQKQISKLKNVDKLSPEDNPTEYIEALGVICDYIDNIDIANDFHKIGGLLILRPCLKCANPKIRAGGCELVALLTQNNPYCQKIILDNDFMPELLELLDKDNDTQVAVKSVYAISGIVRENTEGFNQLISYNGPFILLKALKTKQEKIIVKIAFLLTSLCKAQEDLKSRLVFLDYFPTLIALLNEERNMGHEFVLSLLVQLTEDNQAAVNEVKDPKYNFKDVLLKYKNSIINKEECIEEEQYCRILLHLIS